MEPSVKDFIIAATILILLALIWFSNRVENQLVSAKARIAAYEEAEAKTNAPARAQPNIRVPMEIGHLFMQFYRRGRSSCGAFRVEFNSDDIPVFVFSDCR